MTKASFRHLWLALSPHGFGHAAMTAPVVNELRRRRPGLRLTIQTGVPRAFLETRYGTDFTYVGEIPDFGLRMRSSTEIDLDASARGYAELHADWPAVVEREAQRLLAAAPDLVLANVPYVTIAAAARAGIPVVALSSLQWADIYRHYLGDRPEAARVGAEMAEAYNRAAAFLRVTPAMAMPSIENLVEIGPVGTCGTDRKGELWAALGVEEGTHIGLIAFGGIDHALDFRGWPVLPGWLWLSSLELPAGRLDFRPWTCAGLSFSDVLASADVVVTKPGYGTFVEAAMAGVSVLYVARPDWPECPPLDDWLCRHTRALPVDIETLLGSGLELQLHKLFSLQKPPVALPCGNDQGAFALERMLDEIHQSAKEVESR
ncbi:MAG: hypothetical protein Q7R40_06670 [Phaeospirillum sp.]|nr:hypothetical protein [Phaeospirillum sp.]